MLAFDANDMLLHVDSMFSESVLDGLAVSGSELMELAVRELRTGSGAGSSCGMFVSLTAVMQARK